MFINKRHVLLCSYAYSMKQTVEDDKLKDKISEEEKKTIVDKCGEVIDWLDKNQVTIVLLNNNVYFEMPIWWEKQFAHCWVLNKCHDSGNLFTLENWWAF